MYLQVSSTNHGFSNLSPLRFSTQNLNNSQGKQQRRPNPTACDDLSVNHNPFLAVVPPSLYDLLLHTRVACDLCSIATLQTFSFATAFDRSYEGGGAGTEECNVLAGITVGSDQVLNRFCGGEGLRSGASTRYDENVTLWCGWDVRCVGDYPYVASASAQAELDSSRFRFERNLRCV
jgi:hypothetical protein